MLHRVASVDELRPFTFVGCGVSVFDCQFLSFSKDPSLHACEGEKQKNKKIKK